MNQCEGCTACCHVVSVKELGLKEYQGCPHVRDLPHTKPGCGIYERRPLSCQGWSCMYIRTGWPAEFRPDRCGFIVDEVIDMVLINEVEHPAAQIWALPGHENDWEEVEAQQVILPLIENRGLVVLWRARGNKAIALFRDPKTGQMSRSDWQKPNASLGPDSTRLMRAAELYEKRLR